MAKGFLSTWQWILSFPEEVTADWALWYEDEPLRKRWRWKRTAKRNSSSETGRD